MCITFTDRLNRTDELEGMWKEAALIYGAISGMPWRNNLIQDLSPPGRESNPRLLNTKKWR
jgi:hypothetical protein